MSHYSARAQWNTANARLANKPFDNLFADKPCECDNFVQEPDDDPGTCGICGHLHITIHRRLYAMETRYQPAEYLYKAHCDDCGELMEPEDVPADAERKEETVCR